MNLKQFLIEKINNTANEADIVLHEIMSNIDTSHVDYSEGRLDFNVGIMVKRSSYSRLFMTILADDEFSCKLAKNLKRKGLSIVISTPTYPKRMEVDSFLSNKKIYNKVKEVLVQFIDEFMEDDDEFRVTYEENKEINTDEKFEELYMQVIEEMKERVEEYKKIRDDMNNELERTANEARKETLIRGMEKLKDEYFGNTFKKFKKIAGETMDVDLTRFQKEFKQKFDQRLEDFYEYIVKLD